MAMTWVSSNIWLPIDMTSHKTQLMQPLTPSRLLECKHMNKNEFSPPPSPPPSPNTHTHTHC